MKNSVRRLRWIKATLIAATWLSIAVAGSDSDGQSFQDFRGKGAVWKLKAGFPQPDKNMRYMIDEAKLMQASPGSLTARTSDGVEAAFSFVPPPGTLVVGNQYTAALQGNSTTHPGPPHKIPTSRMSMSQGCTSKLAGTKNGDGTHQRPNGNCSVTVYPPPFRADLTYPNNDPTQLHTAAHADELSFVFQPGETELSNRAFEFAVELNVGQSGVCLYLFVYEPDQPAPAAGTATATGGGGAIGGRGAIGAGSGGGPVVVPPGGSSSTDPIRWISQILAVLLGAGLAWMLPALIHRVSNALQGAGGRSDPASSSNRTAEPYWDEDLPIPPKPFRLGSTNQLQYDAAGNLNLADPATLDWAIRIAHHHIHITGKPAKMYPPELQNLADGLFSTFGEPSALNRWPNWLFVPDPPTMTTSGVYARNYLQRVAGLRTVDVVIKDPNGTTRVEQRLAAPDGMPPHVTSLGFDRRVLTDTLGRAVHVIDPPDSVVVSFPDRANLPVVRTQVSNPVVLRALLSREGIPAPSVTGKLPDGTAVSGISVPDHWPGHVRGWNFSTITLDDGRRIFDVARGVSISHT